jgi:hypothetical protein
MKSRLLACLGTRSKSAKPPPVQIRAAPPIFLVAANVHVDRFPSNEVTGILKDRDLLVLTTTMRENGQPIWVVISLKRAGEVMTLAQTMERSRTIKRGTGKKQVD